jgi:hypothetical protein
VNETGIPATVAVAKTVERPLGIGIKDNIMLFEYAQLIKTSFDSVM